MIFLEVDHCYIRYIVHVHMYTSGLYYHWHFECLLHV